MACTTPSNQIPIPPGQALDVGSILSEVDPAFLSALAAGATQTSPTVPLPSQVCSQRERIRSTMRFLLAQSAASETELNDLMKAWKMEDDD